MRDNSRKDIQMCYDYSTHFEFSCKLGGYSGLNYCWMVCAMVNTANIIKEIKIIE